MKRINEKKKLFKCVVFTYYELDVIHVKQQQQSNQISALCIYLDESAGSLSFTHKNKKKIFINKIQNSGKINME